MSERHDPNGYQAHYETLARKDVAKEREVFSNLEALFEAGLEHPDQQTSSDKGVAYKCIENAELDSLIITKIKPNEKSPHSQNTYSLTMVGKPSPSEDSRLPSTYNVVVLSLISDPYFPAEYSTRFEVYKDSEYDGAPVLLHQSPDSEPLPLKPTPRDEGDEYTPDYTDRLVETLSQEKRLVTDQNASEVVGLTRFTRVPVKKARKLPKL